MSRLTSEQEAAVLEVSAPQRSRLLTLTELAELPAPNYLVEDFIRARGMTVLYGPSGGGKSFAALDWSLCVASGERFYGQEVKRGPVVYIAAEGASGYYKRAQAWCSDRGVADVPGFRVWLEPVNFYAGDTAALEAAISELDQPPVLMVIDTLARCLVGGDENSARDVGLFLHNAERLAKRLEAGLLIVHHTGKNGELERGSSALRGGADTMLSLKPAGEGLKLTCEKQKDAAEFKPWNLHLESKNESCVVRPKPSQTDLGRFSEQEQTILETVPACFGTDWVSGPEIIEASGLPKTSFYRCAKSLIERELLEERQAGKQRKEYRVPATEEPSQTVPNRPMGQPKTVPPTPHPLRGGTGDGWDRY